MVKVQMDKLKVIMQILWESVFMDKYNDVFTYYTLHIQEGNYGNIILETSLR